MIIQKKCACGKSFKTHDYKIKKGRGKFCNIKCKYKYAVRPSGLKYILVKENPTSFKKGQPKTENWYKVMKDRVPYNKGTKGLMKPNRTSFKREMVIGDKNTKWKGDGVGYFSSHAWMIRSYGKADRCENKERSILGFKCSEKSIKYDWAFMGEGKFKRNRNLYIKLCHSCHMRHDWQLIKKV